MTALIGTLLVSFWVAAQAPAPAAARSADPKFTAATQRGEAALKLRRWDDALDAFKDANALENKKSAVALYGMSRAHHGIGAFKTSAEVCAEALRYTGEAKRLEASLHNQRGMAFFALYQQDDKNAKGAKYLTDAEAEFRLALAVREAPAIAWYNLGVSLLRQNRDDEGRAALQSYLDSGARAPEVELARKMIENPRRGRETYAPEFTLTTLDGQRVSLAELAGKTVVLDFWGTWCGPCRAATSDLVRFAKKYSTDPNFVMIGISSDRPADEQVLRDYIAKHKMDWLQQFDNPRRVISQFQVTAYPTYVVIDGEGIVRERLMGWPRVSFGSTAPAGSSVLGTIEAAVKKSLQGNR